MLVIGNKKFRNLPEQVGYNTEQIEEIKKQLDGMVVEDHLVVLDTSSGTLTDEELNTLDAPLAFVSYNEKLYVKTLETLSQIVFKSCELVADEIGSAYYALGQSEVIVTISTKAYAISTNQTIIVYSKAQVDSIIANIMAIKLNVSDLLNKTYPVGAIYISTDNISPASSLGGTWTNLDVHYLPKGSVPVLATSSVHDVTTSALKWKTTSGSAVDGANFVLGIDTGGNTAVGVTSSGNNVVVTPSNLWGDNNNSTYNTAIYLWQRVA